MTKIKSKTAKTNRRAPEPKPEPKPKKKGKTPTKKPSAKKKEQPTAAPPTKTETEIETAMSDSVATETADTTAENPVAAAPSPDETASVSSPAAEEPSAAPAPATTSESRMPPIGTVLQKRDRNGNLRCECEIVESGVRYGGTVYKSLSSAAVAAAKDLGLAAKAMNGFTWWGVSKPARPTADPLGGLERAWNKYQNRLEAVLERAKAGEHKESALTTLERHTRVLQNLHEEVA